MAETSNVELWELAAESARRFERYCRRRRYRMWLAYLAFAPAAANFWFHWPFWEVVLLIAVGPALSTALLYLDPVLFPKDYPWRRR